MTGGRGIGAVVGCGLGSKRKNMWRRRKRMMIGRGSGGDDDDQRYGVHGLLC